MPVPDIGKILTTEAERLNGDAKLNRDDKIYLSYIKESFDEARQFGGPTKGGMRDEFRRSVTMGADELVVRNWKPENMTLDQGDLRKLENTALKSLMTLGR